MPKPPPTPAQIFAAENDLLNRFGDQLPGLKIVRVLRVGGGSRPHVAIIETDELTAVIKDHGGCDKQFARWLGPLLARREVRSLRQIEALDTAPSVLKVLNRRAFMMSRVEAIPYRQQTRQPEEWKEYFEELKLQVDAMHDLGVAHCDMRSPDNTLIDSNNRPVLVDFVASYRRGARWNLWSQWVFSKLCTVDHSAIEKQKRKVAPHLLKSPEAGKSGGGAIGWLARKFGERVRDLSRFLFTGR